MTLILTLITAAGMASAASKTLASGTWTKKSNGISGNWKVIDYGSVVRLKFYSFKTKSAPDLKVYFHPKSISSVTSKNATAGALYLAKLKSTSGYQEYDLPKGFKISSYKSVIIHCEQYTKLWGGADL